MGLAHETGNQPSASRSASIAQPTWQGALQPPEAARTSSSDTWSGLSSQARKRGRKVAATGRERETARSRIGYDNQLPMISSRPSIT